MHALPPGSTELPAASAVGSGSSCSTTGRRDVGGGGDRRRRRAARRLPPAARTRGRGDRAGARGRTDSNANGQTRRRRSRRGCSRPRPRTRRRRRRLEDLVDGANARDSEVTVMRDGTWFARRAVRARSAGTSCSRLLAAARSPASREISAAPRRAGGTSRPCSCRRSPRPVCRGRPSTSNSTNARRCSGVMRSSARVASSLDGGVAPHRRGDDVLRGLAAQDGRQRGADPSAVV